MKAAAVRLQGTSIELVASADCPFPQLNGRQIISTQLRFRTTAVLSGLRAKVDACREKFNTVLGDTIEAILKTDGDPIMESAVAPN